MDDLVEECEYGESCDSLVESRKSSTLSWLWSNGLWLGKKVAVTGVVISSAPLLFPPLVVATFLGIAVSVPAGVVLVCYTCTEKLMNRLLPCSASPSMVLGDEEADVYFNSIKEPKQEKVAMAEKEQQVVSGDMNDIDELVQEDASVGKVAMAEKQEQIAPSDTYNTSIKDIKEAEQEDDTSVEEVAMAETEQEVDSSDIKDVKEAEQEDGSLDEVAMAEKEQEVVTSDSKYIKEPEQEDVGNVEEVAMAEKEQEVTNSIKDSEEVREQHTEVEPTTIIDWESYMLGANEYSVGENTGSSYEKSHPKIEGLGGVDKKESSNKETVMLPEVMAVREQEEVAMEEKEQQVVNSIKDGGEPEQNEVPHLSLSDKKSHAHGTDECNVVENTGSSDVGGADKKESSNQEIVFPLETSDEMSHPKIEDLGGVDKIEPSNNKPVLPLEEIVVVNLVQDTSGDAKREAEIVLVASAAQDTSGEMTEEKILEDKTKAAVKKVHDDAMKHQHTKKKNYKKKTKSSLKTSHEVEEREEYKSVQHTKETGNDHEKKLEIADHNGVKGDKTTTSQVVVSSVPTTVEMKSVILESSTTKRDEKPIRYRRVPIVSNQADENPSNVDENVKLGMKNKESIKEIAVEDDLDKHKAVHPNTKAKGTIGNIDKRRAESAATGVHKEHPLGGGLHPSKQDSGPHKAILANEKKLWDQIEALRLIVGYKVAKRTSLIEEVKSLYVFTGVKPPSPFKNSDNIHVTEEKLHFLMSIVGVK